MKNVLIFRIIFLSLVFYNINYAQEPCSEIKVAVVVEIAKGVYDDHSLTLNNYMMEVDWEKMINDFILNFLKESNPEVNFVSSSGDYMLELGINRGFSFRGKLSEDNKCGSNYILKHKKEINEDLFQAIKNLIGFHFDQINRLLLNHENKHIAPARGPKLVVDKSNDYLSPILAERELDITSKVYNCRWEVVFDKKGDQIVVYPKKTSRTETYPTHGQQIIKPAGDNLHLGVQRPNGVSATFKLKRGINASIEEFEITACGRDSKEIKEVKINIYGLEILVKPQKSVVKSGENINVDLFFKTVSPYGEKWPVAGKELNILVKGIVDGSISPSKKVTTNSEGKATLQYKAGRNDEKITVTASYQPINYPDKVIGSSIINVVPNNSAWNGKLTYQYTTQFECTHGSTINESENRNQFVELLLSMEKIDFKGSPVARINNVKGSGNITISYSSKKEETRKEYYGLKTIDANETFPVDQKNLIGVVLQKKMSEDPEAMRKRFEELSKSDPQKLMQEIKSMSNQQNEDEFPIEVVLNISGNWPITAKIESISKSRFEDKNDSRTENAPYLFKPMSIKLEGTMNLNADGTGTINAFYSAPEDLPNGKPASFGCPPIKGFVDCKLMLVKTKAN